MDRSLHENPRSHAIKLRHDQNREMDGHAGGKYLLQSYNDREFRPRDFEEAHERIPSSVAEAEMHYNQILRNEQKKHQSEGAPYFDPNAPTGNFHY